MCRTRLIAEYLACARSDTAPAAHRPLGLSSESDLGSVHREPLMGSGVHWDQLYFR